MARPVNPRTRWNRIDQALLLALLLPRKEYGPAMERIAIAEDLTTRQLRKRIRWLGLFKIEARMGAAALKKWETHCKSLIRLYKSNLRLFAAVSGKADEIRKQIKEFEAMTYGDRGAANLLGVSMRSIQVWSNTFGKLERDHQGRFTGKELARFAEENPALISGGQFRHRKAVK